MRITVVHNPTSGFEQLSKDELLDQLCARDLEVKYYLSTSEELARALENPGELIVIAGGDGTIGRIAKQVSGRGIPIGVFPLGTANNVASALAHASAGDRQNAAWTELARRPYDLGLTSGAWGKMAFLESAGIGVFAQLITTIESDDKKNERPPASREEQICHVLGTLRELLPSYPAHACQLTLDGEDYSGRYVSIEIMNIRFIGPNVELAPQADPGDGQFDVVLLTEDDCDTLGDYLRRRLNGDSATLNLPVRQASQVRISSQAALKAHVDDEIVSLGPGVGLNIGLKPGVLEFIDECLGERSRR